MISVVHSLVSSEASQEKERREEQSIADLSKEIEARLDNLDALAKEWESLYSCALKNPIWGAILTPKLLELDEKLEKTEQQVNRLRVRIRRSKSSVLWMRGARWTLSEQAGRSR